MKICENVITAYQSANFTEDETAWTSGAVFNNGDEIREGNFIYKYAGIDGTNSDVAPFDGSIDWLLQRPSNYYAMLDSRPESRTSDQTVVADEIIVSIDLNNVDTIVLLNLDATTVNISIEDLNTSTIVYDMDFDLNDSTEIVDALSYYFSPFVFKQTVYASTPLYGNARATITITKTGDFAKCGRLFAGQSYDLGITLFNVTQNLESYSIRQVDEFGTPTLRTRGSVYNSRFNILAPASRTENLKRKRKELDAIPILFIGDESESSIFENMLSYGLWEDATMQITNPVKTQMNLSVKELL